MYIDVTAVTAGQIGRDLVHLRPAADRAHLSLPTIIEKAFHEITSQNLGVTRSRQAV